MATRERDRGQAASAVVIVMAALGAIVAWSLVDVGDRLIDRSRAQTAADAVALVSLEGGRPAADRLARRHGAQITTWTRRSGLDGASTVVTVVVVLGDARASARASNEP
jgi:hypothetical protein